MISCTRCKGRVFIDRVFSQKLRIELFCSMCGKRWFVKKDGNKFGTWLDKREKELGKEFCIFI
jgi:hypothetical protein